MSSYEQVGAHPVAAGHDHARAAPLGWGCGD